VTPGKLWAESYSVAEQCYKQLNQTGSLVGMAYTVRDMMQIVDALGEGPLLNYWGKTLSLVPRVAGH
jgi:hypothetical protein